ncbi:aminoglycoside phosphotransferase family protein [Granulicoccus sp. GXG6511]|uniref:aminoglycoside phosphotransferase family protein n=1 Tax=Granulicoccus sp. GXG6511 TaxID=3381351 RepID=UPI003D7C417A
MSAPDPDLERTLRELLAEWQLTPVDEPFAGVASLVQPVHDRAGFRCCLKVSTVEESNRGESATLQVWHGRGAVELLRADPRRRAVLLEWLGEPLTNRSGDKALSEVARLYGVLHLEAAPQLPSLFDAAGRWLNDLEDLGRDVPAPPRFVQQALRAGRDLITDAPTHVVHGDLHDGNVLWRERTQEWVVIDPKGYRGDPAYEPAPMLWNRWDELEWFGNPGEAIRDRFYVLVDGSGLDERRARDWVVVRAIVNVSWAVLDARRERRELTDADNGWITRNVTLAKAMQEVQP